MIEKGLFRKKSHIDKWEKVPHACPATMSINTINGVEQCNICGRVKIDNSWQFLEATQPKEK
jgi:hypothetical protein